MDQKDGCQSTGMGVKQSALQRNRSGCVHKL